MAEREKVTLSGADVGAIPASVTKPALSPEQIKERDEQEALRRVQHGRRLNKAIDAGFTITGLRMSNPKDEHATGVVVTFDEDEQKQMVDAVRKIIGARK